MVSQADILSSASRLGFSNRLTAGTFANITFEPTIGIAAGRIDKLGIDIRSFHEPLKRAIKEVMIPSFFINFDVGGRPRWAPLSEGTMEVRKHWGYQGIAPLLWTHKLFRVTQQQNIWTVGKDSAYIADLPSKVWYGKIHQAGMEGHRGVWPGSKTGTPHAGVGGRPGGKREVAAIPARPFLVIQPQDRDAITVVFAKWLDERVARASWGRSGGKLG